MKKLSKEQVKELLSKHPNQLTKEELSFIFHILSFQIKEYYLGKNNLSFEIHFERIFIIRMNYPNERGLMSFNNEFVNFGEGCHGTSMPRAKDTGELLKLFVNMFHNNLLSAADYTVTYNEEESMFDSLKEAQEYLKFVQNLI